MNKNWDKFQARFYSWFKSTRKMDGCFWHSLNTDIHTDVKFPSVLRSHKFCLLASFCRAMHTECSDKRSRQVSLLIFSGNSVWENGVRKVKNSFLKELALVTV
jgi:hypothetical protein